MHAPGSDRAVETDVHTKNNHMNQCARSELTRGPRKCAIKENQRASSVLSKDEQFLSSSDLREQVTAGPSHFGPVPGAGELW